VCVTKESSGSHVVSRRGMLKITGTAAAVGLAGCSQSGSGGGDTFTIGALHPLSGDAAEMGSRFQDVVGAGVQAVNQGSDLSPLAGAEGEGIQGQDGATVEVLWRDHQGASDVARSEAESLVLDENVDMLTGCFYSGSTQAVSQVAEREGIPHVCGTAIGEGLTERGLDWFWQVPPHTGVKGESMFNFASDMNSEFDVGLERVAIIHQNGTFGTEVANSMVGVIEENSEFVQAPETISYDASSVTSLSAQIQTIRDADADIIVHAANVRDALIMLEDMKTEDYYPEMMLTPGSAYLDPSVLEESVSEHVLSGADFSNDMYNVHPPMGEYNSYAQENSGTPFDGSNIYAWGEFFTAVAAANKADSLDPADLQNALNSLSLDPYAAGLPYPVDFDDNGYNSEAFSFVVQADGGKLETVWPFEQAQDNVMTYPVPDWSER
jgi:branched-chain amino acid transport system substrate-binding protein